jgi:predicted transposase/invertase (TIGR01784 family)
MTDKLTIVDVKAEDEQNTKYQIEVHLSGESNRAKHILYTWSTIYQSQLKESESFENVYDVRSNLNSFRKCYENLPQFI